MVLLIRLSLLRQNVYVVALDYEELNDHLTLRAELALQTAIDCDEALGSQATLCRLEDQIY